MMMMVLVDLVVAGAVLYLISNLVRYFFISSQGGRGERGNPFFRLSDSWLDEKNKESTKTK